MNNLQNILAYLEGTEDIEDTFVEYLLDRAKRGNCTVYRTILVKEDARLGDSLKLSDFKVCSARSLKSASLKAAKSFAKDMDKNIVGKKFVTVEVINPLVCIGFSTLLRYLEYFDNISYTKNIIIPRLINEQEFIIVNDRHGRVIEISE